MVSPAVVNMLLLCKAIAGGGVGGYVHSSGSMSFENCALYSNNAASGGV